jgi:hypothetical protein
MANAETDAGSVASITADEIVATELELGLDLNGDGAIGIFVVLSTPLQP